MGKLFFIVPSYLEALTIKAQEKKFIWKWRLLKSSAATDFLTLLTN